MSNGNGNETLLYLDTTQIIEPDVTNVRPWSSKQGDTEEEVRAIEELAATIEQEGQIQPVKVRRVDSDGGMYELIAGRRRKKAIELINASRKSGEELKVMALASDDEVLDANAYRQAFIENWNRSGIAPMDMTENIAFVRKQFKWNGKKSTKKVAEFFGVSEATVTQYELLSELPEDMQVQVHSGVISRDDAFALASIAAKQGVDAARETLADALKAGENAKADAVSKGKRGDKAGKGAKKKVIAKAANKAKGKKDEGDEGGPRSKKELVEFFEGCMGPVYGYPDGAVHLFCANFIKYAAGEIKEPTLNKYFKAMVEKAYKGTAASVKEEGGEE